MNDFINLPIMAKVLTGLMFWMFIGFSAVAASNAKWDASRIWALLAISSAIMFAALK